jgi:hypothetical protein
MSRVVEWLRQIRSWIGLVPVLITVLVTAFLFLSFLSSISLDFAFSSQTDVVEAYGATFVATVAVRLLQVVVLYFAVLVAAFRLLDTSERLGFESTAWLFGLVIVAQIAVATSAVLSALVVLDPTARGLFSAVALIAFAFLMSLMTPIVGLLESPSTSDTSNRETLDSNPTLVGISVGETGVNESDDSGGAGTSQD